MEYAYLIFTISMVLPVITGFLSVFILVPRGLVHRDTLTTRCRMAAGFAIVGILIPLAFLAEYAVARTAIASSSMWISPASPALAALDAPGSVSAVVVIVICGLTKLSNIELYPGPALWVGSVWNGARGTSPE
jgi:hypothetical protein